MERWIVVGGGKKENVVWAGALAWALAGVPTWEGGWAFIRAPVLRSPQTFDRFEIAHKRGQQKCVTHSRRCNTHFGACGTKCTEIVRRSV